MPIFYEIVLIMNKDITLNLAHQDHHHLPPLLESYLIAIIILEQLHL